jgi:hypothetical protein
VQKGIVKEFTEKFVMKVVALKTGSGFDASTTWRVGEPRRPRPS